MKFYWLALAIATSCHPVFAEIKNGYENDVESVRRSLRGLNELLKNSERLSTAEKRKMEEKVESMLEYITYYEITKALLTNFHSIAPELYEEVSEVKDAKGATVDVYVKFIPKAKAKVQAAGTTVLGQSEEDADVYLSEYGKGTVSVKIWVIDKALWVLAHEFGHVKYQVANLKSYIEFHKNNYLGRSSDPNRVGHNPNDPSGKSALAFEKRFREHLTADYRNSQNSESPVLLLEAIRKRVREGEMTSARR